MPSVFTIPLAVLFVFLAGFNVWIMLTGRGASPRSRRLWSNVHRIAGHTFIALFVVFCYFMLLRVRGSSEEMPPRLILHMSLAFLLLPLLLAKVMAVRYQQDAWKLLMVLGIGIFGTAFTLVALNVSVHYLRIASRHKTAIGTSATVIAIALGLAAGGYLTGIKRLNAKPEKAENHSTTLLATFSQLPSRHPVRQRPKT